MEQPLHRSWWSRNWKWFVPVGCFGMILAIAVFVGGIVMVAAGAMKSSDAYKEGLARAKASPAVTEALGSPIEAGFFTSGKVDVSGPSGTAQLSIPISGPKGKGTVFVEGTKSVDWSYTRLEVVVDGTGEKIDLLAGS